MIKKTAASYCCIATELSTIYLLVEV